MQRDQGAESAGAFALSPEDRDTVEALRARREDAFRKLVVLYHGSLVALATTVLRDGAAAQEVVQEAWIGVLQGIDRFEGRSSLRSWIYAIVLHKARTRRGRDARSVSFSALAGDELDGPAVDPDRFLADGPWVGHWRRPPEAWGSPEADMYRHEVRDLLWRAISDLPEPYREVITLRDVDGLSGAEVCNILGLSATNQRVVLHRARSRVRRALERRLSPADGEAE